MRMLSALYIPEQCKWEQKFYVNFEAPHFSKQKTWTFRVCRSTSHVSCCLVSKVEKCQVLWMPSSEEAKDRSWRACHTASQPPYRVLLQFTWWTSQVFSSSAVAFRACRNSDLALRTWLKAKWMNNMLVPCANKERILSFVTFSRNWKKSFRDDGFGPRKELFHWVDAPTGADAKFKGQKHGEHTHSFRWLTCVRVFPQLWAHCNIGGFAERTLGSVCVFAVCLVGGWKRFGWCLFRRMCFQSPCLISVFLWSKGTANMCSICSKFFSSRMTVRTFLPENVTPVQRGNSKSRF